MSNLIRPSTPTTPNSSRPCTPSNPVTGTWRHPQADEIARRQNASTFTDRNLKQVIYNAGGMVIVAVLGSLLWSTYGTLLHLSGNKTNSTSFPKLFHEGNVVATYGNYIYWGILFLLGLNILGASMPLLRAPDDISDIPLTPAQRKLLGLAPTSKQPTPGSQYSTPPRYARTPTPMSGSPGSRANSPLSGSPLQTNGSRSNSPFSPGATPYLQKAIGGVGFDGSRRHSYGSPSPLGPAGSKVNLQEIPGTPSPITAKGASVSLNNRWLFEKGRRNSGNARLYA